MVKGEFITTHQGPMGEREAQTIGCKTGYKDVLYDTGNMANIL